MIYLKEANTEDAQKEYKFLKNTYYPILEELYDK